MVHVDLQLVDTQVSVSLGHARKEGIQVELASRSLARPRVPELCGPLRSGQVRADVPDERLLRLPIYVTVMVVVADPFMNPVLLCTCDAVMPFLPHSIGVVAQQTRSPYYGLREISPGRPGRGSRARRCSRPR